MIEDDHEVIHFFISRSSKDADIATMIGHTLEQANYRVLLQNWDFANRSFMERMHSGLSSRARVIMLLSRHYMASDHCMAEFEATLASDPRNKDARLIVLRIDDCDPAGLLAPFAYWDLVPLLHDASALSEVILDAVKPGRRKDAPGPAMKFLRASKQIVHNEVHENVNFTGCDEDLAQINDALWSGRTAAVTNIEGAAAVKGLGGVGKTVLAREYAWQNREHYQGVWWIHAEEPETLLNDLVALGSHFIPGLKNTQDPEKAAGDTLDHIWQGQFPKPWLLIYDNVEKHGAIEHLTPRGGAHVLITTRWPYWDDAAEISVDVFPEDIAIEYLMKRARKTIKKVLRFWQTRLAACRSRLIMRDLIVLAPIRPLMGIAPNWPNLSKRNRKKEPVRINIPTVCMAALTWP